MEIAALLVAFISLILMFRHGFSGGKNHNRYFYIATIAFMLAMAMPLAFHGNVSAVPLFVFAFILYSKKLKAKRE